MPDWVERMLGIENYRLGIDIPDTVVVLFYFENINGENKFLYLATPLELYDEVIQKNRSGVGFNFSEYGEILASGDGEPNSRLKMEMARLYNVIVAT